MSRVQIEHDLKRKSGEHDEQNRSLEEKSAKLGDLETREEALIQRELESGITIMYNFNVLCHYFV